MSLIFLKKQRRTWRSNKRSFVLVNHTDEKLSFLTLRGNFLDYRSIMLSKLNAFLCFSPEWVHSSSFWKIWRWNILFKARCCFLNVWSDSSKWWFGARRRGKSLKKLKTAATLSVFPRGLHQHVPKTICHSTFFAGSFDFFIVEVRTRFCPFLKFFWPHFVEKHVSGVKLWLIQKSFFFFSEHFWSVTAKQRCILWNNWSRCGLF